LTHRVITGPLTAFGPPEPVAGRLEAAGRSGTTQSPDQ
jgi:hypothetical protein